MKKIRELLKKSKIKQDLSIEKPSTNTVRLLYVSPFLNSDGYYRMILPYLELGTIERFETRVTSVTKWDFAKTFTIGTNTIKEDEIQWANYIIFPMLTGDYSYLFHAIRILNPTVSLVMDVTKQMYHIPKSHRDYEMFSKTDQDQLLKHLIQMDIITTPIKNLCTFYQKWIGYKAKMEFGLDIFWLPSLISKIGFEDISSITEPNDKIIRIGIIGAIRSALDLGFFITVFKKIKEKYKDKVELIVLGWDGKNKDGSQGLKEVEITFHKSVSFLDYFQTVENLHFDIVLFPLSFVGYKYEPPIKVIEIAAMGIPLIAQKNSSYAKLIEHGENGLLAFNLSQWEEAILQLIDNSELRLKLGKNARKWAWQKHSYSERNITVFKKIFY